MAKRRTDRESGQEIGQESAQEFAQESGEDRLIARHFKPLASHPGAFGLLDDAAVLSVPKRHEMVLKTDAIVGGVHFFADDPPDLVARKALRVNLSDLAAKGAKPAGFLLSLALPRNIDDKWLARFVRGLEQDAREFDCPLFGGDTVRTPGPVTISVSVFGTLPKGTIRVRMGARPGDLIAVTGTIGDAALGLQLRLDPKAARRWKLDARMRAHLSSRYLLPRPRNLLAAAVRKHTSGAMDVSDGLVGDLRKMLRASGVGAEIEVGKIPLSKAAAAAIRAEPKMLEAALTGGDDFEVLASVRPASLKRLQAAGRAVGVPVTVIGKVTRGQGCRFLATDGRELAFRRGSYSHF